MREYFKSGGGAALRDGWFPTGDVATIDADSFMQITDRAKDVKNKLREQFQDHLLSAA